MKFYSNQISLIIDGIKNKTIKAILLYGPDKGLISFLCKKISSLFSSMVDLEVNSEEELRYELDAYDLFGGVFLKKIHYKKELDSAIRSISKSNYLHFPVIIAEDAKTANSIRILFEQDKKLASVGCYAENEIGIKNLVKSFFESRAKHVSSEALEYIILNASSDRLVILSELEKLLLYAQDKSKIEIDDVLDVLSGSMNLEIDKLCFHFIKKEFDKYFNLLDKMLKNDHVESVLIVRCLIKYYNHFFVVKKSSLAADEAIKSLTPPIFFSYINDFKLMEKVLTTEEVAVTLQGLLNAELDIKKNNSYIPLYKIAVDSSKINVKIK